MLNSGSCLAGGHDDGNNDQPNGDGGGQQYEGTGGKKQLESSRLKKSSGNKDKEADAAEDDCPKYGTNNTSGGSNKDDYNGGSVDGGPYCGDLGVGVGGYGNGSPCGGGGSDSGSYGNSCPYGTGGNAPYNNAPAAFWAPQDGARSPLYINTQAVHVYGMPCVSDNDNNNDDHKRTKRGDDGFFGPVFHAVGHFLDRKFGFDGRDR